MQKNSEFEELFALMAASRKKCPWAKEKSFEECAADLLAEVKELLKEIEAKDNKKTMQELGDVFFDSNVSSSNCRRKWLFYCS
jgi:NTP pyrophosphatase (non-canonical NTP hydrolase)